MSTPSTLTRFGVGASTALTNAYSAPIKVTNVTGTDAGAQVLPAFSLLQFIRFKVTSIASSAASITYFLSLDSAGDVPITPEVTVSIVPGKTTATSGGAASALSSFPLAAVTSYDSTNQAVYVIAKTNTGTCTVVPYVYFKLR